MKVSLRRSTNFHLFFDEFFSKIKNAKPFSKLDEKVKVLTENNKKLVTRALVFDDYLT